MEEFNNIEDTLFVPMLGRIYATEKFPNILNDKKALSLKDKLPKNLKGENTQTEYTLMAGAIRSFNMDRYIGDFLKKNKNGIIVELGCGLETTYYRYIDKIKNEIKDENKNNDFWYEVDLPNVIEYRKNILGEEINDKYISCSAFDEEWINQIRNIHKEEPILVVVSGVFYYFTEEQIKIIIDILKKYKNIEIVFDIVNYEGMKQMSKYMKQVGHEDAKMFYYVDDAKKEADKFDIEILNEEVYYKYCNKKGLKFTTYLTMKLSDMLKMVKMIHFKIS